MLSKEQNWLLKEKYQGKPTKQFYKDVDRLAKGEPLAYVIGFTEFLGCKIDLSKKPLVPRPETEFWVKNAISELKSFTDDLNRNLLILDIFSGSGCIGLAILKQIENAQVIFADAQANCITQIKINLKLNKSFIRGNKAKVVKSDIFSNIDKKQKFDYIFANPPYIPKSKKNKIQKSVLEFEPNQALFGGEDGMFFISKFLKGAKKYLNSNGKIFMEFDGSNVFAGSQSQKLKIQKLVKKIGYKHLKFYKDQYGRWRWIVIK